MSSEKTIAIIESVRESTLTAIQDLYNVRKSQKKYSITQSASEAEYVSGVVDDYNDEIDNIIENIPDDPPPVPPTPTLPTVTTSGDFGDDNMLRNSGSSNTVSQGAGCALVDQNGNSILYDKTVTYATIQHYDGTTPVSNRQRFVPYERSDFYLGASNTGSGNIGSGSTNNISKIEIAVCHSTYAERVCVYDQNDKLYNAFKYTLDNIDYYFVLDKVQTDWVSDLTSIGYHKFDALPTVYFLASRAWSVNGSTSSGDKTIASEHLSRWLKHASGFLIYRAAYDWSTLAIWKCTNNAGTSTLPVESLELTWDKTDGGTTADQVERLSVINTTSSSLTVGKVYLYKCQNLDQRATVIHVYDSNNKKYNSFRYVLNNTVYYYVIDGTNASWTDDLASIGYSLMPAQNPPQATSEMGFLRIKSVNGKIVYEGNQTRNISTINGVYQTFIDSELTQPFSFNMRENRYVFGYWGDSEQTKFLVYNYLTKSDFPIETNIYTSYIYMMYSETSIQCLKNSSSSTRNATNYYNLTFRKYNDVISLYFAQDHNPTEIYKNQEWDTGIFYDESKTYKATAIINTYNGEKIAYSYILDFVFISKNDGHLWVKYTGNDYAYPYFIGLFFYAANEVYFTQNGELETQDTSIILGVNGNLLFDKNGSPILYDSSYDYIIDRISLVNTNRSSAVSLSPYISSISVDGVDYLGLFISDTETQTTAYKVEFTRVLHV